MPLKLPSLFNSIPSFRRPLDDIVSPNVVIYETFMVQRMLVSTISHEQTAIQGHVISHGMVYYAV
jgi:hypothetical protein